MARGENHSSEHFDWLVSGRSRNQQATLALYKIIEENEVVLATDLALQRSANQLIAIGFSLWRAVFLSDLSEAPADQLVDARKFLRSLIAHNAVLYQTDFNTREWTFRYYLDNALLRLRDLTPDVLAKAARALSAETAKDKWANAQAMLDAAIANFAEMIADHASH